MRSLLFLLGIILAAPAAAAPDWRESREYDVLLSSFEIQPRVIELKAGEPVRLRFINNSTSRHSFSARDFFRSGEVRPRDRNLVSSGTIVVQPGSEREVVIVPRAGRYKARSASLYHRILGMTARIVVK
jgi:uncharacterized cupredoxin-like copper-binding protein